MRNSANTLSAPVSPVAPARWLSLAFVASLGLFAAACTQSPSSETSPTDSMNSNPSAAQNAVVTPETSMSASKDLATLPPLDQQVPAHLETATFALG